MAQLLYVKLPVCTRRDIPFQDGNQWGKRNCRRVPDHVQVDLEVRVNETIAHAKDGFPGNLGKGFPATFRDLRRCFSYYFNTLHQSQSQQSVFVEIVSRLPLAK